MIIPYYQLSNASNDGSVTNPLKAVFRNCIIYGETNNTVKDEVAVNHQEGSSFEVEFENTLYNSPAEDPSITYIDCLPLIDPLFKTIDQEQNIFDFHLQSGSPCINAGALPGIKIDLDGNARDAQPDIGAYEAKP